MVVCPNCRIENLEGTLRCKNCGMPLTRPLEAYQQPVVQYAPPQMYQQPSYPPPGYQMMQTPVQPFPRPKTAKPIIGGIIALLLGIIGMIAFFVLVLGLPPGAYIQNWFFVLMIISLICCFITVPLSIFAILRRHYPLAVLGGILSIGAAWMLLGIITMAIALIDLILIAISKNEFS